MFRSNAKSTYTSKLRDILLDPLKSLALIHESIVRRNMVTIGQKAIEAHAIVDGDNDDVVPRSIDQARPIQIGIAVPVEAATLYKNEHGEF